MFADANNGLFWKNVTGLHDYRVVTFKMTGSEILKKRERELDHLVYTEHVTHPSLEGFLKD